MPFVTRKHLDRRTFLKGAGAGIALPLLDAMLPAFASSDIGRRTRRRIQMVDGRISGDTDLARAP